MAVIGHYFIWNTAERATNGDLDLVMDPVKDEKEADEKAKTFDNDPFESYCAYMQVHDDGTVHCYAYGVDEIGAEKGAEDPNEED